LFLSVKDVNPNDQGSVFQEFTGKLENLLTDNKDSNFLTEMYGGSVEIQCSPPLGTMGYFQALNQSHKFLKSILMNGQKGFATGTAFLECLTLILAKISFLDWTSMDESLLKMRVAQVCRKFPIILQYGWDNPSGIHGEFESEYETLVDCNGMKLHLFDML
jgi:hypothetical protein